MNDNDIELGYEQVYRERLEETRSMVTLATLLDFLDQGAGDGYDYDSVMAKARAIAERGPIKMAYLRRHLKLPWLPALYALM